MMDFSKEESTIRDDKSYVKRVVLFMEMNDLENNKPWSDVTAERFLAWHHIVYATTHGTNRAKSVVAQWHLDNKWKNPFDSHRCKKFTRAIMKTDPVPPRPAKLPFPIVTWKKWLGMRRVAKTSKEYKLMADAIIGIGLRTMARGKELAELKREDVVFKTDGAWITFKKTKTKSKGRSLWLDNASKKEYCPVDKLKNWMQLQEEIYIVDGSTALFTVDGKQLSTTRITTVVQWVANACDDANKYTAHSLRAGGATEAAFQGMSQSAISGIGDWSTDSILAYFKSSISGRKVSDEMGFA
jgi:integrase